MTDPETPAVLVEAAADAATAKTSSADVLTTVTSSATVTPLPAPMEARTSFVRTVTTRPTPTPAAPVVIATAPATFLTTVLSFALTSSDDAGPGTPAWLIETPAPTEASVLTVSTSTITEPDTAALLVPP